MNDTFFYKTTHRNQPSLSFRSVYWDEIFTVTVHRTDYVCCSFILCNVMHVVILLGLYFVKQLISN